MKPEKSILTVQQEKQAIADALRSHRFNTPDSRLFKQKLLFSAMACLMPGVVFSAPQSGQVVSGDATITTPDANTTLIQQATDRSIINWQSFSIGANEYVQFIQPDTYSVSLNRVIGGNPSSILGNLSANGQVYLVNPNGIYFGQGVQVDVSGITASVLDISDNDFINGQYVFSSDPGASLGSVVNEGVITARNNGYVVLLGDYTQNTGVIQAQMGKVVLASGSRVTMDVSGNNLVSVVVDEATVSHLAGVDNSGEIYADGGRVIMTAKVAGDLIGTAVNNSGLVRANAITEHDGAIFLTAAGGDVTNSGTLDASARTGDNFDGGGVLVYSDKNITLSSGATLSAQGDGSASGGVVRVIAEDTLDFQAGAAINTKGGNRNGGFVEVSGHGGLNLQGVVTTGTGGSLLIDPANLTIQAGGSVTSLTGPNAIVGELFLEGQLSTSNVTLVASNSINAGTATFSISATGTAAGNLSIVNGTVAAGGTFNCTSAGVCLPGTSASVIPGATGSVNLGNVNFNIAGGLNIAAGSTAGSVSIRTINAGGNVSITAGGDINVLGVSGAGASFLASAGNDLFAGQFGSTIVPLNAAVTLNAGNNVNINRDIRLANNILILAANNDGLGAGDVIINGAVGANLAVITQGAINVSGVNFNINGADFGSGFTIAQQQQAAVLVQADDKNAATTTDNITVNLTGQMNVKGGRIITRGVGNASVSVFAGNDLNIVAAGGLAVNGGTAVGSTTSGFFSTATALADASLIAGRDINLTLAGGNLVVQGGNATGRASGASTFYTATGLAAANALVTANNNITVNAVGGNLVVGGGAAIAEVLDSNASGCNSCDAMASANGTVRAPNVTITNVAGNLSLTAGNAQAGVNGLLGSSLRGIATASANATLSATALNASLSAGGLVSLAAGTALVNGAWTGTSAAALIDSHALANVNLSAGNNVVVSGSGLAVTGGIATATPVFGLGTGSATASAKVIISAVNQTSLTATAEPVTISNGIATAGLATLPDIIAADANVVTSGNVTTSGVVATLQPVVFITPRLQNIDSVVARRSVLPEPDGSDRRLVRYRPEDSGMCRAL